MSATHTLDRPDLARRLVRVNQRRNLLVVLSRDGWLFPGLHLSKPVSTRQLHRIAVEALRVGATERPPWAYTADTFEAREG